MQRADKTNTTKKAIQEDFLTFLQLFSLLAKISGSCTVNFELQHISHQYAKPFVQSIFKMGDI
jgi:hypothetical protein